MSVLEKLKALDAQRASFWRAPRKRPLIRLKRRWPNLTNSASITDWSKVQ